MSVPDERCEFHHIHIYVDKIQPLEHYKAIEHRLNQLANKGRYDPFSGGVPYLPSQSSLEERLEEGKRSWEALCRQENGAEHHPEQAFSPTNQDLVEQLIVGLGWRVTAEYNSSTTQSVLVSSLDPVGVKFVITTLALNDTQVDNPEMYKHFESSDLERFYENHAGRAGIAVLGFEVFDGRIASIRKRYQELHPSLIVDDIVYEYKDVRTRTDNGSQTNTVVSGWIKVFEVFAYYKPDSTDADKGTVLRFVERSGSYGKHPTFSNPQGVLPGLSSVPCSYDGTSIPAYCDHWVSNVHDREAFLSTLQDTLGFVPKVDFNAGVISAGRAKIESTVIGNTADDAFESGGLKSKQRLLRDQSQVYLPINNAISSVGHVFGFLQEIGQGVQHLANRVEDLVSFIERVNNYRHITGKGMSFLNIPRSYYGMLDLSGLEKLLRELDKEWDWQKLANMLWKTLQEAGHVSTAGIVELNLERKALVEVISPILKHNTEAVELVSRHVLRARYCNIYKLLGTHLSERKYLQIVKHRVLVDIQGEDVLYQIFTSNILQRKAGEEAPFLEFIQRVCSENGETVKPGCGGFGIRNFLTLFLSIEVSKAMDELEAAVQCGDAKAKDIAEKKVKLFTEQLNESNPILTEISDAMTAEADALRKISLLKQQDKMNFEQEKELSECQQLAEEMSRKKKEGNEKLQGLSTSYADKFKALV